MDIFFEIPNSQIVSPSKMPSSAALGMAQPVVREVIASTVSRSIVLADVVLEERLHLLDLQDGEEVAEALVLDHVAHELHGLAAVQHRLPAREPQLQLLHRPVPDELLPHRRLLQLLRQLHALQRRLLLRPRLVAAEAEVAAALLAAAAVVVVARLGGDGGAAADVRHASDAQLVRLPLVPADAEVLLLQLQQVVLDGLHFFVESEDEELVLPPLRHCVLDGLQAGVPPLLAGSLLLPLPPDRLSVVQLLPQQVQDLRVDVGVPQPAQQRIRILELVDGLLDGGNVLL